MLLVGVSLATNCAFLPLLEVHPEVAMGQCLERATLHLELIFVFSFDLKGGSGAFGEKIPSLDFFILSLFFSCKALGFILEIEINQCQCWHIDVELILFL